MYTSKKTIHWKKIEEKEMKNRVPFLKIQLWIQSALVGMVYIKLFKNGKYLCGIFHIYSITPSLPYYIYIWRNVYILRFQIFPLKDIGYNGGVLFFIRLNVLLFWRIKKMFMQKKNRMSKSWRMIYIIFKKSQQQKTFAG